VDIEAETCKRYEAELAAIAALDRDYYVNSTPTPADRAGYFRRQDHLEQVRAWFYAELSTVRHSETTKPGMFCVLIKDRLIGQSVVSAPQCMLLHDLNNSLGVVIGRSELLADLVSENAGAAKHLSAILDTARTISKRIQGSSCPIPDSSSKGRAPISISANPDGTGQ